MNMNSPNLRFYSDYLAARMEWRRIHKLGGKCTFKQVRVNGKAVWRMKITKHIAA